MFSVISGVIVTGAGVGGLWYCRPHNGKPNWLVTMKVFDWLIPILIVTALALGVALVVAGVMG
jgi:hypothetical protein